MILHVDDDSRSFNLESLTRDSLRRRRPRFGVEGQTARCPICGKVLVAYISVRGPAYLCGCNDRPTTNGNRPT